MTFEQPMNFKIVTPTVIILTITLFISSCGQNKLSEAQKMDLATEISWNSLILDSHIDWPENVLLNPRNIAFENEMGDFDYARARKGGLNAVFSVLYIDPGYDVAEGREIFDSLFHLVASYKRNYPGKFSAAIHPADIRKNVKSDLLFIPLCLENGSIIGNEIDYIRHLKDLGIVYITLNHNNSNQISDSNVDRSRPWNGLSSFGENVVDEMNRLGIIVDISHSSDSTVADVLKRSKAPIVATHSACRKYTPGYERNLPDELIQGIADKGGVIMIPFGSFFLDSVCCINTNYLLHYLDSTGISYNDPEGMQFIQNFMQDHKMVAEATQVVDHIDHVVEIAGIDHVGLGSDFDGIGPAKPVGIPDVSAYPVVVAELINRGYSRREIKKILGGNFLRVWKKVLKVSAELNDSG